MDDPVDDGERQQRERQPDEHLFRHVDRIDGHHDDDGRRNERREQHAQRDGDYRGPPERCDGLGQARMVYRARILGVGLRFERDALCG